MLLQAIKIHIGDPINQVSGKSIENSQRNGSFPGSGLPENRSQKL
jgi:hypothetical protein